MTVWMIADTHLGHSKIIEYCQRPFDNVGDMDQTIIDRWNERVHHNDLVIHLGDLGWFRNVDEADRVIKLLNGNKVLIPGNHDKYASQSKLFSAVMEENRIYYMRRDGVIQLRPTKSTVAVLCHYPIDDWPGRVHGYLHFHGHTHGQSRLVSHRFDIGVEVIDYAPIKLEDALWIAEQEEPTRAIVYNDDGDELET